MGKISKTVLGVVGVASIGVLGYTLMNKKLRKKAIDLKDAMIDEVK